MNLSPSSNEVDRFRAILARQMGLRFDDSGLSLLGDVLKRRADARGQDCDKFLVHLDSPQVLRDELRALAIALTVGETYFFRNPEQFQALAKIAVPDRMSAHKDLRELRVLVAGCASGEEAYSLALVLRESMEPSWKLTINAVDINPVMIAKARAGRYSAWSLRATEPEIRGRWFTEEERELVIDDLLKTMVVFEECNLAEENADVWRPECYDVVFCRNVIMYFTPEAANAIVKRIACSLMPGGYLFLGHAETLRGLSQEFHLQHTHQTFYYQRRTNLDAEESGRERMKFEAEEKHPLAPFHTLVDGASTWVDAIRSSADRIRELTSTLKEPSESAPARIANVGWNLGRSLELLKNEQFDTALDLVDALPPESARDPEVLLLRAVLLTHGGQFVRAETVCRDLLNIDELNSGAHYLLALCREGVCDLEGAVEQDQIAVYLDPGFAMPRLHLGLIARRTGNPEAASREFGRALLLLEQEDASRLLLFGGGFRREALIALCRAEVAGRGGTL